MPPELGDLYTRYADTVYRTALRVTGSTADAEDVLQTVFLRVLKREEPLDPLRAPEGFLRRSAANAAIDVVRRRQTWRQDSLSESPDRLKQDSSAELKERLRQAIATLDARDAEMFVLRYMEGLANGEIAEMYGLEKTTIAVRLHRIRESLKVQLGN
ncbi:MAG: sigma-70 family RNA polymerase sigma factor [Bryobacteraceae bacterium]|nr:sigma-70 family RNA polymerase sigma factor [Bryobacteraceae bacterium]